VARKEFGVFPTERMNEDFAWQVWLVGWLAIFKAFVWLAYEPNLSPMIQKLLGYKYTLGMVPLTVLGIGVWNQRRWAVWGIVLVAAANIVFFAFNLQVLNSFLVHSEVLIYSVLLSAIVLICNGPIGDLFILMLSPMLLRATSHQAP
jgi:hypothetical protein